MDWALAIDRNRRSLFGLVAAILALLRMRPGAALPRRRLFCAALTLLKAAAAAGPRSDVPARAARLIQRLQAVAHASAQTFDEERQNRSPRCAVDGRSGRLSFGLDPAPSMFARLACAPNTS
jgi:hypothetical protein